MWAGVSLSLVNLQPDVGWGFRSHLKACLGLDSLLLRRRIHLAAYLVLAAGRGPDNSLLVGCLIVHPHNMAAGFSSEWVIQEKAKQKWEWYFWHSLKVIFYHLCRILRVVQTCPDSLWQKTTQKWWGEDTRGHVAGCLSSYNTHIFFLSAKKKKKKDGTLVYIPTYQPCDWVTLEQILQPQWRLW